jgi:hypothetical protein
MNDITGATKPLWKWVGRTKESIILELGSGELAFFRPKVAIQTDSEEALIKTGVGWNPGTEPEEVLRGLNFLEETAWKFSETLLEALGKAHITIGRRAVYEPEDPEHKAVNGRAVFLCHADEHADAKPWFVPDSEAIRIGNALKYTREGFSVTVESMEHAYGIVAGGGVYEVASKDPRSLQEINSAPSVTDEMVKLVEVEREALRAEIDDVQKWAEEVKAKLDKVLADVTEFEAAHEERARAVAQWQRSALGQDGALRTCNELFKQARNAFRLAKRRAEGESISGLAAKELKGLELMDQAREVFRVRKVKAESDDRLSDDEKKVRVNDIEDARDRVLEDIQKKYASEHRE